MPKQQLVIFPVGFLYREQNAKRNNTSELANKVVCIPTFVQWFVDFYR